MGPTSHANTQVIQKVSLKVPNGPNVSKSYPKKRQEKPKSKLGLPGVTIRDQIIPQPKSPR